MDVVLGISPTDPYVPNSGIRLFTTLMPQIIHIGSHKYVVLL